MPSSGRPRHSIIEKVKNSGDLILRSDSKTQ